MTASQSLKPKQSIHLTHSSTISHSSPTTKKPSTPTSTYSFAPTKSDLAHILPATAQFTIPTGPQRVDPAVPSAFRGSAAPPTKHRVPKNALSATRQICAATSERPPALCCPERVARREPTTSDDTCPPMAWLCCKPIGLVN